MGEAHHGCSLQDKGVVEKDRIRKRECVVAVDHPLADPSEEDDLDRKNHVAVEHRAESDGYVAKRTPERWRGMA